MIGRRRRGFERGRCPLYLGEEKARYRIKMIRNERAQKRICT
jgi:hypothetical protein